MIIQTTKEIWGTFECTKLLAQNLTTFDVICETETPPQEYVEVEDNKNIDTKIPIIIALLILL